MRIVFLEPLGVPKETLCAAVRKTVGPEPEIICFPDRREEPEELVRRCQGADVAVFSNIPFPGTVIAGCPDLRMLCVAFTGTDHVDLAACRERGITVCNCAGYSTTAVADLVFGLVIDLARNILPCDQAARTGGTRDGLVGFELEGKTFGVIGLGAIGSRVARIAEAFGCRVLGCSRTPKDLPGVTWVDKETLLRDSDIVSLHVPQSRETRGLIGRRELEMMKPTALLINTARGPVVDIEALAWALKEGVIAGAGVDVFEQEPPLPPDHPLCLAPNTVLTPHVGFASHQAFEKRAVVVAENIRAWMAGAPQNLVTG